MKRGHRIKPTIEPKYVLIEVGLQMFWFDAAMMRSLDPCLQVAENEMDHRQVRLSFVGVCRGLRRASRRRGDIPPLEVQDSRPIRQSEL